MVSSVIWDGRNHLFFGCEGGYLTMVSLEEKVCPYTIVILEESN
jgi:hypothetical protein